VHVTRSISINVIFFHLSSVEEQGVVVARLGPWGVSMHSSGRPQALEICPRVPCTTFCFYSSYSPLCSFFRPLPLTACCTREFTAGVNTAVAPHKPVQSLNHTNLPRASTSPPLCSGLMQAVCMLYVMWCGAGVLRHPLLFLIPHGVVRRVAWWLLSNPNHHPNPNPTKTLTPTPTPAVTLMFACTRLLLKRPPPFLPHSDLTGVVDVRYTGGVRMLMMLEIGGGKWRFKASGLSMMVGRAAGVG